MAWFAVRIDYLHCLRDVQGLVTFGQTLFVVQAEDDVELTQKASQYWLDFLADRPAFQRVGSFTTLAIQGSDDLIEGREVWSDQAQCRVVKTSEDSVRRSPTSPQTNSEAGCHASTLG